MKYWIGSVLVLVSSLFLSCSSSDDTKEIDPIFSLPYTPLSSMNDLDEGDYAYVGIKIADQKVGMITPTSTTCARKDFMTIFYEGTELNHMIYYKKNRSCSGTVAVMLSEMFLENEGVLATLIGSSDQSNPSAVPHDTKNHIRLEVGFQGEYLRIEDRMSNFTRTKHNEKVYLYFKKK